MLIDLVVHDGPMKGRSIASPTNRRYMAAKQVVLYHGNGASSTVGPVLYQRFERKWRQVEWTPEHRLAVPEQYELHFFGAF